MQLYELIAPCHFGMESVLKNEIYDLGYNVTKVEDGRVFFEGDSEAIVRANIGLRTAERILLNVGTFHAESFDELFEGTFALPWDEYLPQNARFWVTKASSVKSRLFSPSDIQSIMKKAMAEKMTKRYHIVTFPEDGASYPVRVFIKNNEVTAAMDTSGESLHKRGWRRVGVKAPIAENLAAGLIMLTPWRRGRILVDPFCGSGTIPIEAAMMAANIAPGMHRSFTAMSWDNLISSSTWKEVKEEAYDNIDINRDSDLQGYDIDSQAVSAARENARLAGVDEMIHFQTRSVTELSHSGRYGFIITNPPYGQRLQQDTHGGTPMPFGMHPKDLTADADPDITQEELEFLYRTLGERFAKLPTWSMYVITSYEDAQRMIGRKAARNRKIYNGMIRTYYYMYPGPRPIRNKDEKNEASDYLCNRKSE